MKLCVDCKHCTGNLQAALYGADLKCDLIPSPVTGLPYLSCEAMRVDSISCLNVIGEDDYCGPNGDRWEPRHKARVTT